MTKKEIVKQISQRAKLTQLKTKQIVQWTFEAIIDTLATEGRIELRNFGIFEVKRRKARKARNPKTDEKVIVPEKNVVTFQPGKRMETKVEKLQLPVSRRRRPREVESGPAEPVMAATGATESVISATDSAPTHPVQPSPPVGTQP